MYSQNIQMVQKIFFHLINHTHVLISHDVYKFKTGSKIPLAKFQLELARQLIKKYGLASNKSKLVAFFWWIGIKKTDSSIFSKISSNSTQGILNPQQCYVYAKTQLGPKRRKDSR